MFKSGKMILTSLGVGVAVWIMNAILDSFVFGAGEFQSMLWSGLELIQITHRFITVFSFVVFGFIISLILDKLKTANLVLSSQQSELNRRVTELDTLCGISFLSENKSFQLRALFLGIIKLISPALLHKAHVRILFEEQEYFEEDFAASEAWDSYDLIVEGKRAGCIELHWIGNIQHESAKSDRHRLMQAVAERCGKIIERKRSKEELKEARDNLRSLAAHLHSSRENERQAIAREIHDELGQVLTALKINLSVMEKQINNPDAADSDNYLQTEISDMKEILDVTIIRVRKLITDLRPEVLDNLGLIEALHWQAKVFGEQSGISTVFENKIENIEFNKDASIALFRIYQESLTNVARHANATEVKSFFYKKGNNIILSVDDNGIGFEESKHEDKKSFGLLGMRERAMICGGTFEIQSSSKGTKIIVSIPVENCM